MSTITTTENSQVDMTPAQMRMNQLFHLCCVQAAANESLRTNAVVDPSSRGNSQYHTLTPFQKVMCRLAQVCQFEKGGDTVTALVCLKDEAGRAELVLASNSRKEVELMKTKMFLENFLGYVGANPDKLNAKALQKQVMWRILESNYGKVDVYLKRLSSALEECIAEADNRGVNINSGIMKQLVVLQDRTIFPRDMTCSTNAGQKFLKDCETLIKAIQASRNAVFESWLDRRADSEPPDSHWQSLRHHLGRLHSFRQSAEIIVEASSMWPELFDNFKISYILSARRKSIPLPRSSNLEEVFSAAFPESDISEFCISETQACGLKLNLHDQITKRSVSTFVHSEIHLHNYLVGQHKTRSSDFWDDNMFIASSKPTCQLCHYYFKSSGNEFMVQSPHMNLYPKWRLPDNCDEQVIKEIIEQMQAETRKMLMDKVPRYKRNDSRTDSAASRNLFSPRTDSRLSIPINLGARPRIGMGSVRPGSETAERYHNGQRLSEGEDDFDIIHEPEDLYHGVAIAM